MAPASKVLSFLAFDFGTLRVGVASGNTVTRAAQPLRSVAASGSARFDAIAALIAEWQPDALVVGLPLRDERGNGVEPCRARNRHAPQGLGRASDRVAAGHPHTQGAKVKGKK